MVFLQLEDPTGSAEVVVFSATYATARELCVADRILVVKGRVDHKQQGETKLIALELTPFEAVAERRDVRFRLDARQAAAGVIAELARLVKEYPGDSPGVRGARDVARAPARSRSAPATGCSPTRTSSPRRRPCWERHRLSEG